MGETLFILLLISGAITFILGTYVLFLAFIKSIWWGLGCFLTGIATIIFIGIYWEENKKPFFAYFLSLLISISLWYIPTISTVDRILKRNGLIIPRKRRRRIKPVNPIFDPKGCNEVWSADFKGKFKLGNKKYCHPLTIADSFSRYVFSAKGLYGERFKPTMLKFRRVFREYGMPLQIHTDNGSPFGAAQAIQRLIRLAVWFFELGIEPVYSDPASPQQNGRHERMHQDLKGDATRPPGFNLRTQQRKLNKFVYEYNYVRPHGALHLETPGSIQIIVKFVE